MFERFTERARQVVVLAQDEARAFQHNYIGTEHILLGLLLEEEGIAARVLESFHVGLEEVRAQVALVIGQGDQVTSGQIPFTPRAKRVLELSLQECIALGHNALGTEHLLLGLVRENEGVAARILLHFGTDSESIRDGVLKMLSGESGEEVAQRERRPRPAGTRGSRSAGYLVGGRDDAPPSSQFLVEPARLAVASATAGAAILAAGLLLGWLIWG
jgi:ATP-dependent Clp protease ATP-binding subunit ClpC